MKRLIELIEDGQGRLSVVLAGHPKLRNDLRRPTMEEIGYRTEVFSLYGIAGSQREYILWLLKECSKGQAKPEEILTEEAIDVLATKLRTPLQTQQHLALALHVGYQAGEKPESAEVVTSVLSRYIDDLEPTLTRHGYRVKDLAELFDAKPAEIKRCSTARSKPAVPLRCATGCCAPGCPSDESQRASGWLQIM